MKTRMLCPYCSTLENGMRLFPPSHPCFTVYDGAATEGACDLR